MSVDEGTTNRRVASRPATGGRGLGLALLIIATAQLMLVLDDTIVNIALPSIQRTLHMPASRLNWVISFYGLTFGGLLLTGGRAGDLFGRLRMFRTGIALFVLASIVGGFAPNEAMLITARIVQGSGAALAAPSALSLLATTFPEGPARTKALGVYGSMAGLGSVIGLLLGGTLTQYTTWRWVLFINAPIGVAVLVGTFTGVLVPGAAKRGTLDLPGAVTATLGIASIIYALSRGSSDGWTDSGTIAAFAIGAVLLLAFAVTERLSKEPMLPASVIRDRNRSGALMVMLLLGTGMLAMFYLLTLYMQLVRGYSALHTGLAYLPFVLGVGAAAGGLGPKLLAALPARTVLAGAMLINAASMSWYALMLTPTSSYWVAMVPAMLVGGISTGLTFVACTALGMRGVAQQDSGVAAGLVNTTLQCGGALGLAVIAAVASAVTRNQLAGHAPPVALTHGYVAGLLAGAIIYLVAAIAAGFIINVRLNPGELAAAH